MCTMSRVGLRLTPALAEMRLQREPKLRLQLQQHEKQQIKRNLFGAKPGDAASFVRRELRDQADADRTRWNFDFQREKPLNRTDHKYQWIDASRPQAAVAPPRRTRQTSINDYMKPRKRASSGDCPSPKKLARLNMDLTSASNPIVDSDSTSGDATEA